MPSSRGWPSGFWVGLASSLLLPGRRGGMWGWLICPGKEALGLSKNSAPRSGTSSAEGDLVLSKWLPQGLWPPVGAQGSRHLIPESHPLSLVDVSWAVEGAGHVCPPGFPSLLWSCPLQRPMFPAVREAGRDGMQEPGQWAPLPPGQWPEGKEAHTLKCHPSPCPQPFLPAAEPAVHTAAGFSVQT